MINEPSKKELEQLQATVLMLQQQNEQYVAAITKLEDENAQKDKKIQHLYTKQKDSEGILRKAYEKIKQKEAQLTEINTSLKERTEELVTTEEELRQQNEQISVQKEALHQKSLQLEKANVRLQDGEGILKKALEKLKQKEADLQKINLELKERTEELIANEEELRQQNEEISAQHEALEKQNGTLEKLTNKLKDRESILKKAYDKIKENEQQLQKANHQLHAQKSEIENQNHQIISSITYAYRIQQASLPNDQDITEILPNHFVFYKPRDIVSGDFYFIKKINDYILIVAADCSGHGVPGALLSMLGIALLNEIVRRKDVVQANYVLDELRNQIKYSLQQSGKENEQQDGMDIAFCAVNTKTMQLSFAGAHNSLWLFRGNNDSGTELIEIPADRMPIGIFPKERPFTEHIIQLQVNDMFYIFSDGYHSQFGEEKKEKFKTKRLRSLLSEINTLPMPEQKQIIEQTIKQWQGKTPQIDDMLIIGVRV